MPAPINEQTKQRVIQQWISGDSRDKISIDNDIGEGTVSGIVNGWKRGLEDSEYEAVRELAIQSKKQELNLSDSASHFRLQNIIKKSGTSEDKIESFIANVHPNEAAREDNSLPPEKIVDLVNQLFDISKSESIPLEQVPDYIQHKLQQKQKLDEQIKEAETVLQSKNVAIETIDEHIHLNKELSKHGLSIKDTRKLVNVIKNVEHEGYDIKKVVAKAMSIKSLKDSEKHLRNNCALLLKHVDKYKGILQLAERIAAMKITTSELMALNAAVSETADLYNLPTSAAAFRVINDIRDYNKR